MARKQLGAAISNALDAATKAYWGCAGLLAAVAYYCLRWPK